MIKKMFKLLTSRMVVFAVLIVVQLAVFVLGMIFLAEYFSYVMIGLEVLSLLIVIYLVSKPGNPMYKIAWLIPILLVPVLGGLFYLMFGNRNISRKIRRYMEIIYLKAREVIENQPKQVSEELKKLDPIAYKQSYYITQKAFAPVFQNTYTKLLTPGEVKWEYMLEELKKAQHYIFLEYFIIEKGLMWDSILEVLKERISAGVEVRLLYDDLGSIQTLPDDFREQMENVGIECRVFNRFRPSLDVFMNYRDHRKICIIDGNVGFTGGINLADEYINAYEKHGHWKDTSIMLKGDAVWSLTILFLQMWGNTLSENDIDFEAYKPTKSYPTDGFVQPFGDSPIDSDLIGENTYMNIINNAKEYVYIQTPYLILDHEMTTALCLAAQSGIDVRIITPHIPDKWYVHAVTRANYAELVRAGVKIYEYTPGFIHAKTIVSDDTYAIVGTTNFDFRSFYLHFECGVFLFRASTVLDVRNDFLQTQQLSEEITENDCEKVKLPVRILRALLRVFSPLM
ncbi:Cardiolipin synthase [uncultured Ruminococcus sp.]|uniref:cardiolipin synthase n=1 Tax=Massiliimalia timonensis TaxID=1987501 RepID=UPI0008219A74|nr:cardiolipin synthase [Massiliimalia timonensis]SCH01906.1 Cardiolipin synthase [uncultured Clostridium sp.]SCH97809.1 Cardiolipin synthase [uncultured Ruminococcus sp.]